VNDPLNARLLKLMFGVILALLLIWSMIPIFWLILTALRPNFGPLQDGNPFFFVPALDNFRSVIGGRGLMGYFLNSLMIGLTSTVLSLVLGITAAYGLARFSFRGRRICRNSILLIRMLPPIGFAVPLFIMFNMLGLLDRSMTLIVVYTAFLLPFSIWMLTSAIQEIPRESEESALVEGCTHFQVLKEVLMPQLWPSIASVGLLNLIAAWNEFLFALVLTSSRAVTLPVAVTAFLGDRGVHWGEISAAATLTALLPICLLVAARRYFLKGFSQWIIK